jgi:hypothetical protein
MNIALRGPEAPMQFADRGHMEALPDPIPAPAHAGPRHAIWERCLSFPCLIAGIFAAMVYAMIPRSIADPDLWWHLRNAQYQVHFHRFLTKDLYSFTAAGAPWMDHEWLAELPFYLGWHALGERGVFAVTVVAIEGIMLGVFYLAYRRSCSVGAAALVSIVAAMLATVSFGPRTLLFGWLCLVVELIVLERFHSNPRVAWALPPLFLLWINTHGSWLIGIVVLVAFAVCGSIRFVSGAIENIPWSRTHTRTLIRAIAFSTIALFANPYGWRLVPYPFNMAFHQALNIANVEEWHSLDLRSFRGRLFLVSLTALFLSQLLRRRRWTLDELAFLFIGIYAGFAYSRFLFLAAILSLPLIARHLTWPSRSRKRRNHPWLNALLLVGLTPLVASHPGPVTQRPDADESKFPVQALPFLRGFHPRGSVFNEYLWGGFLEWNVRQIPVMIDPRADIFEYNGTFKDYLDAVHLKDTRAILDRYRIRYVLFERDAPLVTLLRQTPEWTVDYEDTTTILLERTTSSGLPDDLL